MKRIVMLMVCVCGLLSASGQRTAAEKACVAEVRKMYQEAKAMMAEGTQHEEMQNDMVVTISSMEPAVGRQVTNYHYYFQTDYSEELRTHVSKPYFVTKSFNVAPRKYYEEFLYDLKTGEIRFVFMTWDEYDGRKVEARYYFDKNGSLVWQQLKDATDDDVYTEEDLKKMTDHILNGFHSLKRN